MELIDKAETFEKEGDYLSAIDYYQQAVELISQSSPENIDKFKLAEICTHLANLSAEVGDFDSAIKYYKIAGMSYKESSEYLTKIFQKMSFVHTSIAICLLAKSDYDETEAQINKAIESCEKILALETGDPPTDVIEFLIFNYALLILCSIYLDRKIREILPFVEKSSSLGEKYGIEGFAIDLIELLNYIIYRNVQESYKIFKNKIENSTDTISLTPILNVIFRGLLADLVIKNIPGIQIKVPEGHPDEKGDIIFARKIFEDMLLFSLTFANRRMHRSKYQEVIALIVGKLKGENVIISEIIPMTSGTESEVQFQEEHYARSAEVDEAAAQRGEFIVGWFHTHPGLGIFLSATDLINQLGYQNLNPKAVAMVFDFTQLSSKRSGLGIFRLDDASFACAKYHTVRWRVKEGSNNLFFESISFFNRSLAKLNQFLLQNHEISLTQIAEALNRSEILLEETIPKLIELEHLPNTSYNPKTKMVSRQKKKD